MKKTKFILAGMLVFSSLCIYAQGVGINTTGANPDPSAMLDVAANDKGVLVPRMTLVERNSIIAPEPGLLIYCTDDSCFNYYNGVIWRSLCNIGSVTAGNCPSGFVMRSRLISG